MTSRRYSERTRKISDLRERARPVVVTKRRDGRREPMAHLLPTDTSMPNQGIRSRIAGRRVAVDAARFRRMATAVCAAIALLAIACNGVETRPYFAADAGSTFCSLQPSLTCDAVDAGSASCSWQAGLGGNGASLPMDASFPAGCQAYFRSADCSSRGFCTCDGEDEAGTPAHWNCHDADGGL